MNNESTEKGAERPPANAARMSPTQVARLEGVDYMTVVRWITKGVGRPKVWLKGKKVGGHWKITREQLEQFHLENNPQARQEMRRETRDRQRRVKRSRDWSKKCLVAYGILNESDLQKTLT